MEEWILDKRDLDELFYCIKDSNFPLSTKQFLLHKVMYAIIFLEEFLRQSKLPEEINALNEKLTEEDYAKLVKDFREVHDVVMTYLFTRVHPYNMVLECSDTIEVK